MPGFSRNYQATGELPNCLTLSTQLYSKNWHCDQCKEVFRTWQPEEREVRLLKADVTGTQLIQCVCPYSGFKAPALTPIPREGGSFWDFRVIYSYWPDHGGFSEKAVFELSIGGESTREERAGQRHRQEDPQLIFGTAKWLKWSGLGSKYKQSAFFLLKKITVTKLRIFNKIISSYLYVIKIHHLYKNKQQGKKNERTNYCSNSLGWFLSGGHWRLKSKRWGLHKYKLVIGICIAEPLGPAGAAMPQEDQQLGHLGLRCQVRSKEGLLQRRSVSPGEWQLETSASLMASLRRGIES